MATGSTKSRIIHSAIELFNERRFGAVTTAALAEHLEMSEGNLWYHFKNKRALLRSITELFIPRVEARLNMRPPTNGDVLASYGEMLFTFNREIEDFRFLYRDQADYGEHTNLLLSNLPKFFADTFSQFGAFHDALVRAGHMKNDAQQLASLTEASIVAFRFHLEFNRERGVRRTDDPGELSGACDLHLRLFEPLIDARASQAIRKQILARHVAHAKLVA